MSRASISRSNPRALATCDRCGFRYNHDQLNWEFQWAGTKLQNMRIMVCPTCLDVPQEQLRTVILPADPVPIANPRPEYYDSANNPNSPIGQSADPVLLGSNIGTLIGGAGTYSAFNGSSDKPFFLSANLAISGAGLTNWVGKHWGYSPATAIVPTTVASTGLALTAQSFEATSPRDAPFLASGPTSYAFEGSADGSTWTTLASGTTAGTVAETITNSNLSDAGAPYSYHRFVLDGDGTAVAIAQLSINTNRGGESL